MSGSAPRQFDPVAWYEQQQFSGAHDIDPRCLHVLNAWQNLYNLPIMGIGRPDGGFRPTGTPGAVMVRVQGASLATYDGNELTRLVIAAHVYCCRLAIQTTRSAGVLAVMVHPREPDADSSMRRHPNANDLMNMIKEAQRG